MNNKGSIQTVLFFGLASVVIILGGLAFLLGSGVVNFLFGEVEPIIQEIGVVGGANITEYIEYGFNPIHSFVQSWRWIGGVGYAFSLIALLGLASGARMTGSRPLMGLYFLVLLVIILGSIYVSNMFEDLTAGAGTLELIMQDHTLLGLLILNAPVIFVIIGFVGGIIMFSGVGEGTA